MILFSAALHGGDGLTQEHKPTKSHQKVAF